MNFPIKLFPFLFWLSFLDSCESFHAYIASQCHFETGAMGATSTLHTFTSTNNWPTSTTTTTMTSLYAINGDRSSSSSSNSRSSSSASRSLSDEYTNYNFIGLNTNQNNPYVPSGLSPDQYEKIKRDEAARQAKMDFGAWGPRFKRTDAPDGDWMVQTNLWINGFQNRQRGSVRGVQEIDVNMQQQQRQRQLTSARTALASFALVYLTLDILLLAMRASSTSKQLVSSVLFLRQGLWQTLRQQFFTSFVGSKLSIFKLLLAAVTTPLASQYRDVANRRWLWSRQRIVATPIAVAFGAVTLKFLLGMGLKTMLG